MCLALFEGQEIQPEQNRARLVELTLEVGGWGRQQIVDN